MKQEATPKVKLRGIKKVIAISSCKGGVGKSTISAALAQELVRQGYKVGLLDADVYGPSVPTLFNIHNPVIETTKDRSLYPIEKDGLKLMSFGFLLGDKAAVLRGPIVTRYIQQFLFQVLWGELDYLIIDFPPGTGDVQITITQGIEINEAVIITTNQALALVDVERGIKMFQKMNTPIKGFVINMAYVETSTGEKIYPFGETEAKKLTENFEIPLLAEIPISTQLGQGFEGDVVDKGVQELANYFTEGVKACQS